MIDIFDAIKGFLKPTRIKIDNWVFFLHSKVTFILFIGFTVIVSSKQYIGDPIDCLVDEIPTDVMDAYCWIYSTFTVEDHFAGRLGKDVAHAGVGPHVQGEDRVKYHKYYQWVGFVLFFQAILFYIPRYIWKSCEKNRVEKLVNFLNSPTKPCPVSDASTSSRSDGDDHKQPLLPDDKQVCSACESPCNYTDVVKFIITKDNRYYYKFGFCELLNLANVVGQFLLIDCFLDGGFISYGYDAFQYIDVDPDQRYDPLARVFPKVSKCTFHKYGPSGTVQKFEGLCVLPVNILNEKIYLFLWFWLVALIAITVSFSLYSFIHFSSNYRYRKLFSVFKNDQDEDLKAIVKLANKNLDLGDWFLVSLIGDNTDYDKFKKLIHHIAVANRV